jgi:large subunit ribosomal protein L29
VSKLSERRREIHAMTMAQSQEELAQMRKHLFELRLQKERGEVKNNRQFAQVKADIARLMHHLGELNNADLLEAEGIFDAGDEELELPAPAANSAADETPAEEEK